MLSEKSHAKWICVGVIGGLLQFGVVYQVAFSEVDAPPPAALAAARTGIKPKSAATAAGAAGNPALSSGRDVATDRPQPATKPVVAAVPSADTAVRRPRVAGGRPSGKRLAEKPAGAQEEKASPLASLLSASSVVTAKVAAVPPAAPSAAPVPGALGTESVQLTEALPLPGTPASTVAAPKAVNPLRPPVENKIREVFGADGEKAVQVARCESELRPQAQRGEYLGLFQMGANERADYGHGPDAEAQIRAAHALFRERGWQPWTCA